MTESIGRVETKEITFNLKKDRVTLDSGSRLRDVTLAYQTYGKLSRAADNAVLILHAFSGNAHAAGLTDGTDKPGWWDSMIGPGKAFDTEKYFIICSNVIGGCGGSTGPSSSDPETGRPYGLSFPVISVRDMVKYQALLVRALGIDKLLAVAGGSMGGMQVMEWAVNFPDRIRCAIPIATTLKHSPQQIAFDEVGRQAVMSDPAWCGGDYYGRSQPERGLALARMIGHITYMSDVSMEKKFSRRFKEVKRTDSAQKVFDVEGYLRYRGDSFVRRFDANSYIYITKAMDNYEIKPGDLDRVKDSDIRFLVISFKSDWLYPSYQSQEIVRQLKLRLLDTTYCEIKSQYGHDAFLIETSEQTKLIKHFLKRTSERGH